jgi:hypothetical protein
VLYVQGHPFFCCHSDALLHEVTSITTVALPTSNFNLVLYHRQDRGKVLQTGILRPAVEAEGDKLYRLLEAKCVPGIGVKHHPPPHTHSARLRSVEANLRILGIQAICASTVCTNEYTIIMHNIMDLDSGSVAVVHTRTFVAASAKRHSSVYTRRDYTVCCINIFAVLKIV